MVDRTPLHNTIEKIQRRFSRMIPSIRKLSYEDRLKELGLWSLEDRRVRADLIKVYKIIHGISSVDPQTFFELSTHNRTRGHPLKLNKNRVHTSSSRMRVIYHNWSATKQRPHPQTAAETSHHSVLSGDRIRQCETSSGSRHKDTDQCL